MTKIDLLKIVKQKMSGLPIAQSPPAGGAAGAYGWLHRNSGSWAQTIFGIFIVWLMYAVFNSLFLGLLCFAFFVFIPGREGEEGFEALNNWIFFRLTMILIFILAFINAPLLGIGLDFGAALPWNWEGPTIIFVAIWGISLFAGWGNIESRQSIGVIMVIISFVLFTMGVGTQSVGKAAFGEWWPTVYKFGSNVFGPLVDGLSSFFSTMGRGFELLSNPVGVANRIASGNYVGDPTSSSKGALGVKADRVDSSAIFPYQPFDISIRLKNEGGADAENVEVALEVGEEAPTGGVGTSNVYKALTAGQNLGFDNLTQRAGDPPGHMEKNFVDEVFFRTNEKGLTCEVMNKFQVRSQYIPLSAIVKYDYNIKSSLPLEIVNREEWARRFKEGTDVVQKKVAASLSNAPIKLNIDSPEQPIREGRPIFIGLSIESAQKNGEIESVKIIKVNYPQELKLAKCTLTPTSQGAGELTWENLKGTNVIFCDFTLTDQLTESVQTSLIKAEANFTYKSIKSTVATMEFGGGCCSDAECASGFSCDWKEGQGSSGKCLPGTAGSGSVSSLSAKYLNANMTYCDDLTATGGICDLGEGHCKSDSQCQQVTAYGIKWPDPGQPDQTFKLECRSLSTVPELRALGFNVCCPQGASTDQCIVAYKGWVDGKPWQERNKDLKDAHK
ncbi:MAG: hypothetical protein HY512_04295 [Candidatus Aenigmarchaeota archaeon]|nr:hypothetical protein [Candidatus Aenigmarchaeota archaeon]